MGQPRTQATQGMDQSELKNKWGKRLTWVDPINQEKPTQ
jgi:hypothetical protein